MICVVFRRRAGEALRILPTNEAVACSEPAVLPNQEIATKCITRITRERGQYSCTVQYCTVAAAYEYEYALPVRVGTLVLVPYVTWTSQDASSVSQYELIITNENLGPFTLQKKKKKKKKSRPKGRCGAESITDPKDAGQSVITRIQTRDDSRMMRLPCA